MEQQRGAACASGSGRDRRNFRAWVAYQACYRIGWQFKMEATMVAGLVSFLSSSPAVIGFYSTAHSVARSLGPLAATPWVDRSPVKRRSLLWLWGAAVLCWSAGAVLLWTPLAADRSRTLWWFFAFYVAFFAFLGSADVAQGALLGKIIPAERRGGALSITHTIAGPVNVVAILIVYGLVRSGGFPPPRNYALAFSVTAVLFLLAGVAVSFTRELPSRSVRSDCGLAARLAYARRMIRENRDYRILLLMQLAMGIGGSALSFYVAYGRKAGSLTESGVVLATVLQVLCQAVSCSLLGRVADRRGNRILIRSLLWVEAMTPVIAVLAATLFPGTSAYLLVYCMVGARFPVFQVMVNYLLEIVPQPDHALALGTSNTLQLLTVASPMLLGALAHGVGYASAMLLSAGVLATAAVAAQFLREPRKGGH